MLRRSRPLVVDSFGLDEIIVLDLQDGETHFRRLDPDAYQQWLDDSFSTGELWQKNLLGRTPVIRLAIVVEGETEEEFVKHVLRSHLRDRGVDPQPIKPARQGGDIRVERLAPEMARLRSNFDCVTTLVDFYGFRGRRAGETVEQLESRINEELDKSATPRPRSVMCSSRTSNATSSRVCCSPRSMRSVSCPMPLPESLQVLRDIRAQFPTPEDINDS